MRIIPTRIHGLADYMFGIVLIGLPYLFDTWIDRGPKVWVPMILGIVSLAYSLMTRYEMSIVGLIPMRVHLMFDVIGGLLLATSPFLFGFSGRIWVPYVVLGVAEIGLSLLTNTQPGPALQTKRA